MFAIVILEVLCLVMVEGMSVIVDVECECGAWDERSWWTVFHGYVFGSGRVDKRIVFGLYQSCVRGSGECAYV